MKKKDDVSQKVVTNDLLPNDVLLGRGTGPNEHMGNCRFRDEVENHKEAYISAPSKATEEKIVSEIVSSIHNNRGRFLRKVDSSQQDSLSGKPLYEVVVDRKVLAYKIKQAIRYSKRRDKKLEAFQEEGNKKIGGSKSSALSTSGTSEVTSSSQTSSAGASSIRNPLETSPDLLSSESERLLSMARNTSTLPPGISQSQLAAAPSHHQHTQQLQRVLAQSQLVHPNGSQPTIMVQNPLESLESATSSTLGLMRPDVVLDQLAMLHLQRTDPVAYQLILDGRRQQQEAAQLGLAVTEQRLLQERSSLLRIPRSSSAQSSRSTNIGHTRIRNNVTMLNDVQAVHGQLGGSIDTPTVSQNDAMTFPERDSKEPASKRHRTS